ncbi:MAG: LptF/LptG family permease [Candidatus Poribacteria bacterium]|nr:LptF/LptG family permease [Candidatus Poribacteria bacterium]MDP6747367.1 LptF/LptG family permease [Candidatus Poribacteria bacterium]MDP6995660.1 LptF/LptG family permease [Candidatus Poribacteria bacterium]
MRILTKYTLKELIPPFLLSLLSFTSMLLLEEIFRLTKLFVKKGISPFYLLELLIYVLPATLVLTIPMSTLVGILVGLGRFATDNEITAMKAHGVGFHQLLWPVLVVSICISAFDFFFMDFALPRGNQAYWALKRDISRRNPAVVLEAGTVMRELERDGKIWMFDFTHPETGDLQNVRVWDAIWSGRPRFVTATHARVDYEEGRAWLKLFNGKSYESIPDVTNANAFRVTSFNQNRISLDLTEDIERSKANTKRPRSMTIKDLRTYINQELKLQSNNADSRFMTDKLLYAEVEYHKKFSIPFACIVFSLIGVPLGLIVRKSGKMVGFGIGNGLILVYYLLLQFGQNTGRSGILSPALSMWLPNIIIGLGGVGFLFYWLYQANLIAIGSPPPNDKP